LSSINDGLDAIIVDMGRTRRQVAQAWASQKWVKLSHERFFRATSLVAEIFDIARCYRVGEVHRRYQSANTIV
jgi:hypothetical protein